MTVDNKEKVVLTLTPKKDLSEAEFKNFVENAAKGEEYDAYDTYDVVAEYNLQITYGDNAAPTVDILGVVTQGDVEFNFFAYDRSVSFYTYFDETEEETGFYIQGKNVDLTSCSSAELN